MNTTSTKQLSAPQRAKIAAQCDAVQSAAAALSFQWATIKSYRGWSARYAAWLCLHAPADLHSAAPVSWPCCGRRVWGCNHSWVVKPLYPVRVVTSAITDRKPVSVRYNRPGRRGGSWLGLPAVLSEGAEGEQCGGVLINGRML